MSRLRQRWFPSLTEIPSGTGCEASWGPELHTVRLIGVDTPETVHPTKTVQHFGAEASAYTKAALEGNTVTLEADPTGDTRDRYGRLLRYVHLDGQNFNARLIREGYGHAIRRFRYSLKTQFIRLEDSARKAGRGLWSPRRGRASINAPSTAGDRLRGQIRPQASGCGPSLYDPLTADKTGGAGRGQRFPFIAPGAELGFPLSWRASIGAWVVCRHVPLPAADPGLSRRMDRARPGQAPCLWHLSRGSAFTGPCAPEPGGAVLSPDAGPLVSPHSQVKGKHIKPFKQGGNTQWLTQPLTARRIGG